ncbi:hypothetical protein LAh8_25 [Aeromonas phage LAh_8]|uniref:Uncharacterized protein n=2 Tax=Lahexavirus TaxID=2843411 RepID=A0A514A018_9CAUD|nr:hypothetical protein HWC30_gp131 [Aeromonas phage LAh_6]YP_009847363.1 hypothetical protein HWC31_gp025 [Aeromonas phage LAh_8]QDH46603.1 hypothetical protein LAh6_131 [Aeromonas phage LAh_6]QDH46831.1 hypothetical protein LAh8_25 [Aeromonas phage LAh_8]
MDFFEIFTKVFVILFGAIISAFIAIIPPSWVNDRTGNSFLALLTFLFSLSTAFSLFIYAAHWLKYNF